jgi:hypothetical protein
MIGLKALIPSICGFFELSPAALYERQRALTRIGAFPGGEGRGPGKGVRANPETLAQLILAVLLTDSPSEINERVFHIGAAQIHTWRKRKRCFLTKAETFRPALSAVLADPEIANKVTSIAVERHGLHGVIYWAGKGNTTTDLSNFITEYPPRRDRYFSVRADINGAAILEISKRLKSEDQ